MVKGKLVKIALIILAILVLGFFAVKKVYGKWIEKVTSTYGGYIAANATRYNVPLKRVTAMVIQESRGNPAAVGSIGEIGLMQITEAAMLDVNRVFSKSFTLADLRNPDRNIECGCAYLSYMKQIFAGDIDKATRAYNAGASRVRSSELAGLTYLTLVKSIEMEM